MTYIKSMIKTKNWSAEFEAGFEPTVPGVAISKQIASGQFGEVARRIIDKNKKAAQSVLQTGG